MEGKSSDQLWVGDWNLELYHCDNCRGSVVRLIYDPKNRSNTEAVSRTVLFYGVKSGTVGITVNDLACCECGTVNEFDVRSSAIFALSRTVVYSR